MRNTYVRFVVPIFVFALAIVISANVPHARLLAEQGGISGAGSSGASSQGTYSGQPGDTGTGSYDQGTQTPDNSNLGTPAGTPGDNSGTGINQAGSDDNAGQGAGQGAVNPGTNTSPGVANTPPGTAGAGATGAATPDQNNANTSHDTPWGSIIISFIVGLVVGGLIFSRRQTPIDRTNLRRSA